MAESEVSSCQYDGSCRAGEDTATRAFSNPNSGRLDFSPLVPPVRVVSVGAAFLRAEPALYSVIRYLSNTGRS